MACRLRLALALSLLPACTGGGDDGAEGGATVEPASSSEGGDTSTGDAGTTGTSTGGETTTTGVDPTTTADPTTGDDTGPICDPGQPACVCDNGLCVEGYVCAGGACMPALTCEGDVEAPDESEVSPTPLADISDDDDEFHQVTGVLGGALDVDWYGYHGADTFGHTAEPTVELVAGTGLRLCQFLECDVGGAVQTSVSCPAEAKFAISPQLRPGCCASTSFTISDFNCEGQDESMKVFIRLDQAPDATCVDYEFKVHF
jgi:hypothetical protein